MARNRSHIGTQPKLLCCVAEVTVLRSRSYDGISFSGRHVHLIASKSAPYRLSPIPENSPMKTFA
ncbi:hypothetical protein ACIXT7_06135 [Bacteroides fragilis]|uniref:hypothetical protein n=1 Tax=Bacteroides fragilis TaxID=817 RepID=UPI0003047610|nr:hypothetical protein [Bacteroides fragilis]